MKSDPKNDQIGNRIRTITSDIRRYMEKRFELMLLGFGKYFSKWMAISVQRLAGAFFLLVGLCFMLFALAIYLGNLLGSESIGYVIVSIPLFVFGLLCMYLKPRRLFNELQQRFEAEVIEALEQNTEHKQQQIESSE